MRELCGELIKDSEDLFSKEQRDYHPNCDRDEEVRDIKKILEVKGAHRHEPGHYRYKKESLHR